MAMPAELNTTVVVKLEFKSADGKVHRKATYDGATAIKVANVIGDILDLATKLDAHQSGEVHRES